MCTSRFSIGMASSRSRPLPWGTPSTTSISTTSANSLAAIQCAAVASTFPAPTLFTFFRIFLLTHVLNHSGREFAGLRLGGSRHLPLKVVGYVFLLDGLLQRVLDQLGRFLPTQKLKQHHAREYDRTGVDHILVSVFWSRAVRGFKDGITVADVGARGNAEPAPLGCAGVGIVVAVEVGAGEHAVILRPDDDLLENGVGDAVVDQQLLLPLPVAVGFANGVDHVLDALVKLGLESVGAKVDAGLDQRGVLFNR